MAQDTSHFEQLVPFTKYPGVGQAPQVLFGNMKFPETQLVQLIAEPTHVEQVELQGGQVVPLLKVLEGQGTQTFEAFKTKPV